MGVTLGVSVPVESGITQSGPQQTGLITYRAGCCSAALSPVKALEFSLVRPSGESYSFLGVAMPTCRSSIQQAEARS